MWKKLIYGVFTTSSLKIKNTPPFTERVNINGRFSVWSATLHTEMRIE